jgi:hypothetical protein
MDNTSAIPQDVDVSNVDCSARSKEKGKEGLELIGVRVGDGVDDRCNLVEAEANQTGTGREASDGECLHPSPSRPFGGAGARCAIQ